MSKSRAKGQKFWNKEYKGGAHLALSMTPSEDLIQFTEWMEGEFGRKFLNSIASVLDLGCGNGRNLIYLAKTFGMSGTGYDISAEAIAQARKWSKDLPIKYSAQSIIGDIPLADHSQSLVLDMMTSHFLKAEERAKLVKEIARVLKPNGWLFFKTFLRDDDPHAERMLRENPAEEEGSYIHPKIGVAEHVSTEEEITQALSEHFFIHKISKSHKHRAKTAKRRSICVYAQKI